MLNIHNFKQMMSYYFVIYKGFCWNYFVIYKGFCWNKVFQICFRVNLIVSSNLGDLLNLAGGGEVKGPSLLSSHLKFAAQGESILDFILVFESLRVNFVNWTKEWKRKAEMLHEEAKFQIPEGKKMGQKAHIAGIIKKCASLLSELRRSFNVVEEALSSS